MKGSMPRRLQCASYLLALAAWTACAKTAPDEDRALDFQRFGTAAASLKVSDLARDAEVVTTFDPFYEKQKRFRALPMASLLVRAFGEPIEALEKRSFVLRASDGYKVPIEGSLLLSGDAYLALDDADVPGFEPIGTAKVSPAPAYLFWRQHAAADTKHRPRPWQVVAFEMVDMDALYGHTLPKGEPADGPAMLGFNLFRQRCANCHAVNRQGGHVGPDLNVPQSIVEYRPEAQIRAYIRDPTSFRYGTMPAHPDLSEDDLDHLLAYFRAMATRKYDPRQPPQ
jgi:mono/diheme cytochrome c family protein